MSGSSAPSVPVSTGSVITAASSPKAGGSISGGGGGTGSPCAACKFLRRKCQPDCVFAPYFPPDNPQKFVHVHRVFGASNVTKILNDLHPGQREDAVNSLAYEADMRLRDPVYGCVGVISILQHRLRLIQQDLACARYELSKYQVLYCCWSIHAHLVTITPFFKYGCPAGHITCAFQPVFSILMSMLPILLQAAAVEAAAASSAAVGSNVGPAPMLDLVGSPVVPNCTQNFINMGGHSMAATIGEAGFMQHDQFTTVQMLARSYDAEAATMTARFGVSGGGSGGGYGFGHHSSSMDGEHSELAPISTGPFFKDERSAAAQ
jgi:hypothetical protein